MDFIGPHNNTFSMLDCMCEAGVMVHILRGQWGDENVWGMENDEDAIDMWEFDDALIRGDVVEIPCDDNEFDVVSLLDNWDRVEDWDRALEEMKRVTRGVVMTTVPEPLTRWTARALAHDLLIISPFEGSTRTIICKKDVS